MPLYEYQCEACGHRFEVIQKVSDAPAPVCPSCGGAVHKLQSAPAFQFKETGWYVTDYARKEQPGSPKSGSASTDDSKDSDSGAKADKPAEAPAKSSDSSPSSTSSSASTRTKSST